MTRLSVNVNKIATLRNSRGGDIPSVLKTTLDIERFGAQGITVHPRPDERHIRKQDVYDIAAHIGVELNIEGYPSAELLKLVEEVRPAQVTLVPDAPNVITSNAGWVVHFHEDMLREVISTIKQHGARVSLFIDPFDYENSDLHEIRQVGADAIELYTELYAKTFSNSRRDEVVGVMKNITVKANQIGLRVNAGHDLNLDNLKYLVTHVPHIEEVSIGHALICDALYFGLEKTIQKYLDCLY